ncbi:COG3545 Predicted esterase of the alpha/beta hydrolase fold [Rhabdaerophilaceae bacterium]
MKTSEASILMMPGIGNSGPEHWQSRWEAKLSTAIRVRPQNFAPAEPEDWVDALVLATRQAERPVVIIAHSLGVIATAHAAPKLNGKVKGAFLVAPSNVERENLTPAISRNFAPVPREPLPFPSILVGSQSDPFCTPDVAGDFANAWGAFFVDAGDSGHINVDSGHGPWPEGLMSFAGFLRRLEP